MGVVQSVPEAQQPHSKDHVRGTLAAATFDSTTSHDVRDAGAKTIVEH